MSREDLAQRKLTVRNEKKAAAKARKAVRRTQRHCAWTWPFGHYYVIGLKQGLNCSRCVGCGKEDDVWLGGF
jgi:hypothetical protein